jgi:hypothetical protein
MPLFKSPSSSDNSNSSTSPPRDPASPKRQSYFRRRDGHGSNAPDDSSSIRQNGSIRSGSGSGFFGLAHDNSIANDPTIVAARQKVHDAEMSEKEADRALSAARAMVREAQEHVKILECEALEE